MSQIDRDFGLTVAALAADPVARIAPDASLYDVAQTLAAREVGVLIVGDSACVAGVVSERDVVRAIADRLDPSTTQAIDVAHRKLVWCDASAAIPEVAMQMMEQYVRHVLVEESGQLVGIVSARDLLGAYAAGEVGDRDGEEDEVS